MNNALEKIGEDLEKQIEDRINESKYYHDRFKELEIKILTLKEILVDLKELRDRKYL